MSIILIHPVEMAIGSGLSIQQTIISLEGKKVKIAQVP